MKNEELKTQLMFHKRIFDMDGMKAKFRMKDSCSYIGRVVSITTVDFFISHVDKSSGRTVKQKYLVPVAYVLDTEVMTLYARLLIF